MNAEPGVPLEADELARRQRLADLAAHQLRQDPELQRAVRMEPDESAGLYLFAVSVRTADGYVGAVVTVQTSDPFGLLLAYQHACRAPLQ